MTKLIYITHPSVNIDSNILPQFWDLSDKGKVEAEKFLQNNLWKEVNAIYSSTEPKAVTFTQMAADKIHLPFQSFVELGEADRSSKPFLPFEEYMNAIKQAYAEPNKNHLGWESHMSMMKRNAEEIEEIMKHHKNQTVVIIGHGGAGTTVKCYIKGVKPSFEEDPKQTGCYFIVDWDNKKILQDWVKY